MTRESSPVLCLVLGLAAFLAVAPSRASQVRAVNLEQMTERAGRIFSGRCVEVRTSFDPEVGQEVTVATFEVDRVVKGGPGRTVAVRMLGSAAGVPSFQPDEEVVLFLYGASALGFNSPVGLGQGRFRVQTDKQGRRIAVNDFANRNLLRDLTPAARARLGPLFDAAVERKELEPPALLDMAEALVLAEPAP